MSHDVSRYCTGCEQLAKEKAERVNQQTEFINYLRDWFARGADGTLALGGFHTLGEECALMLRTVDRFSAGTRQVVTEGPQGTQADVQAGKPYVTAQDSKWVCERHPDKRWENPDGTTCCGGAGKLREQATQDHGACPHCGHKWTRGNENNTCADCDRSIMSAAEKASNGVSDD